MSGEDTVIEEAVDYEADEAVTNPAEEAVDELAAAGQDPTPAEAAVEAASKEGKGAADGANDEASEPAAARTQLDPNDPMALPPQGTEVFIGGIPKSATEDQIKAFCKEAGEVHSVKLAKDPSNPDQNRGFGFARYFTKDAAEKAKQTLHETELKDFGTKVRVSSTQAKHKLYLGNIPRAWTKDQISDELNKTVKGLESFDLVMSKEIPNQNRGYAFLIFYNQECAAAAKDLLGKQSFSLGGRQVTVSYAEPKTSTDQQNEPPKQSKAIYVGSLPNGATEEALKEIFCKFGEVAKVVIPQATEKRPERQFGFVHFAEQSSADKAVEEALQGNKPDLLGNALEVKAARPQEQRAPQMGMDFGGRGPFGRGPGRASGTGRGQYGPGRGRGGRGVPYGRPQAAYGAFDSGYGGYEGGYDGGYDQGMGGFDQGYADPASYGGYGSVGTGTAAASPAGMTMVPMMLPTGQVGYVLQSADGGSADYGSYGGGPDRMHNQGYGGRGRGPPRYRPY